MSTTGSYDTLFPWVGNKKFYIDFIKKNLPKQWDHEKSDYIEPFLGSAVVFLNLKPNNAILSDKSSFLIDIYKCMKENSIGFHEKISKLYLENSPELHETCKNNIVNVENSDERSSMFYYLLRTSLYSFVCPTADGKRFTCCYKSTSKPLTVKHNLYWDLCNALSKQNVQLYNKDFSDIFKLAKKGDFIFIDPPYMNQKRPSRKIYNSFSQCDHERLVKDILSADKRGCYIMLFNHKHPYLQDHLKSFNMVSVDHTKMRKTRSQFATYEEVLYTNF